MTEFKNAPDTVDAIIEVDNKILMIRRAHDPFEGHLALPGGFVDFGEKVETAVLREVQEELQVKATIKALLGVYSGKERDPRGPTISTVFVCSFEGTPEAGDDAAAFEWLDLSMLDTSSLAFDHKKILGDYLKWKRNGESFWSTK